MISENGSKRQRRTIRSLSNSKLPDNRIHGKSRMALFLEQGQNLFFGGTHGFIGNLVIQIRNTDVLTAFVDTFLDFFFQHLGHPDHPSEPAVTLDEFSLGDIELGVTHKSRRRAPPPMTPARVVNFIPQGVSPV